MTLLEEELLLLLKYYYDRINSLLSDYLDDLTHYLTDELLEELIDLNKVYGFMERLFWKPEYYFKLIDTVLNIIQPPIEKFTGTTTPVSVYDII